MPRPGPKKNAVREALRIQATGAFDPLRDDQRIQTLQARLKTDPSNLPGNLNAGLELSRLYEGYGLHSEAFEQYQTTLLVGRELEGKPLGEPALRSIALGIARTARQARRSGEALATVGKLAADFPSPSLELQLGLLYDDTDDRKSAENAYRAAIRMASGKVGGSEIVLAAAHNNLGHNLLLQGQLDQAETQFREALIENPGSLTARNNLGVLLTRRGALDEAWEQFRVASADLAVAHNNFAAALLRAGHLESSREHLVQSLLHRRGFAPALENFRLVQSLMQDRWKTSGNASKAGQAELSNRSMEEMMRSADRSTPSASITPPIENSGAGLAAEIPR